MNADLRKALLLRADNDAQNKPAEVEGREVFIPFNGGRMRALYYGDAGTQMNPLFVDIHGGAFIFASPEEDDYFCSRLHEQLGMTVISLDYPLSPEAKHPEALNAVYAAILSIRENAREWGIDPDNISIGGHSAGGNLAAAVCLLAKQRGDLKLRCQMLAYPWVDPGCRLPADQRYHDEYDLPQDLLDFAAGCFADADSLHRDALCSPVCAEISQLVGLPPAILITCEHDSLRTEGEEYARKLILAGVELSFKRQSNAGHGFTIFADPLRDVGLEFIFAGICRYI